jgi:hypothetical protein
MTAKPPDLEIDISDPVHGRRWRAWRFVGPIPHSIRQVERVIVYSIYALSAFCFSALLWASPTQSDDYPYPLRITLLVLSRTVYLPPWGSELFNAAFGVILVLFGTVLLLFWKHRGEIAEVTWENPTSEATPSQPAEPEEFRGRGTV